MKGDCVITDVENEGRKEGTLSHLEKKGYAIHPSINAIPCCCRRPRRFCPSSRPRVPGRGCWSSRPCRPAPCCRTTLLCTWEAMEHWNEIFCSPLAPSATHRSAGSAWLSPTNVEQMITNAMRAMLKFSGFSVLAWRFLIKKQWQCREPLFPSFRRPPTFGWWG